VRVRGLQSYFREQERVLPGSRVAVNLHGLELGEVGRGDCLLGSPAEAWVQRELVVALRPSGPTAEETRGPPALPPRVELEVALGTGHHPAGFLRLEQGLGRLRFAAPLPAFWNQPCLCLRSGGSQILAEARLAWPGSTDRRLRRRLAEALRGLPSERRASDQALLRLAVTGRIRKRELAAGTVAPVGTTSRGEWLFRDDDLDALEREILRLASPAGGVPLGELASRLALEPDELGAVTGGLERGGRLALRGSLAFLPENPEANLSPFARGLLGQLRTTGTAGLEPERLKIAGARKELAGLARAGLAVSLDGAIFYSAETYRALAHAVLAGRPVGSLLQIAEARAASGLSRKYLIPLLNRMEAEGLVKREGDARRVRRLLD
jgi:selenocysteine-specific elongation factor